MYELINSRIPPLTVEETWLLRISSECPRIGADDTPAWHVCLFASIALTSQHKLCGFRRKLGVVVDACNSNTQELKGKDLCKSEASLSYILSSKPALSTQQNPALKEKGILSVTAVSKSQVKWKKKPSS